MKLKSLLLVLNCLSVSACSTLMRAEFPGDLEAKLIDARNTKIHRFRIPQNRNVDATFLGSHHLEIENLDKNVCYSPSEHSKLEEYTSKLERRR